MLILKLFTYPTFLSLLFVAAQYYLVNDPPRQPGYGSGDIRLPVSQRFQWQESYGYCGEQSLQIVAMYYGTWISSWTIRDMSIRLKFEYYSINMEQNDKGAQWFLSDNKFDPILDALHLTYTPFNSSTVPEPQYETFMIWLKHHIQVTKSPVIIGMYVKDSTDKDFDHVAVAHGILSNTFGDSVFHPNDILLYSPLQETTDSGGTESGYYFKNIGKTRAQTNHGDDTFTIPKDTCYGVAVTGYTNIENTYHTRIELPNSFPYETPSLASCEKNQRCFYPSQFEAAIIIENLTVGKNYTIIRFDTPADVPDKTNSYCTSEKATGRIDFVATKKSFRAIAKVYQTSIVIFRTIDGCPNFSVDKFRNLNQNIAMINNINNRYANTSNHNQLRTSITTNDHSAVMDYYFGKDFNKTAYLPPEMPQSSTLYLNTINRRERRPRRG